jgi:hypothetical protein
MAEATNCSCSESGFLGLYFRSDDLSSTQVGLVLLAATIGIVTFLSLLYRVTRVLLSLFILPGRSVCPIPSHALLGTVSADALYSSGALALAAPGPS